MQFILSKLNIVNTGVVAFQSNSVEWIVGPENLYARFLDDKKEPFDRIS